MSKAQYKSDRPELQSVAFFEAIRGEADPVLDVRFIPERKGFNGPPLKRRGRLSELLAVMERRNAQGYAVYYTAGRTDGNGVEAENIVSLGTLTLDLDESPLPEIWENEPHFVLETSPGKHQAVWIIEEVTDLPAYTTTMRRLAAHYGGDSKVCDAPRVFRAPGFMHQKGKPFRSRIVSQAPAEDIEFKRYSLADFDSWLADIPKVEKPTGVRIGGGGTPELAHEFLRQLPAEEFKDRSDQDEGGWLEVCMSLNKWTGGAARDEWLSWCASDAEFDNKDDQHNAATTWDSCNPKRADGYGVGTLIRLGRKFKVHKRTLQKMARTPARVEFNDDLAAVMLPNNDNAGSDDAWGAEFDGEPKPKAKKWPRGLVYDGNGNTRVNARIFLDARPNRIIAADDRFYSLDPDSKLWLEVDPRQLAVEVVKTDPATRLGHGKVEGVVKAVAYECDTTGVRPFGWLKPPTDAPNPSDLIVFRNGLLDAKSGDLIPHTGDYFATGTPDVDYDPDADCPLWKEKVAEWLDASYHPTLQEMFGYLLTPDNIYEVMFLLIGARGGGKGTISHALRGLVGPHHTSRMYNDLGNDFGLDGLQDKRVCIIPDAHDVPSQKRSIVIERIKSITGRDEISINGKHKDIVTMMLPTRLVLLGNKAPKALDESGALAARQIVLTFDNSWRGKKTMDPHLREKLDAELPGIANWALEGLKRLRERGRFTIGKQGRVAADQIGDGQSVAKRFAKSELVVTGNESDFERLDDVYERFRYWADNIEYLDPRERRNKSDFRADLESRFRSEGLRYHDQKWVRESGEKKGRNLCGLFGVRLKSDTAAARMTLDRDEFEG